MVEETLTMYLVTGGVACVTCLLVLTVLARLASAMKLVDVPNGRKRHSRNTPLVGGIAIYLAIVATLLLVSGDGISWALMLWFGLVLCVGVIDDRVDLSYRIRVVCHSAIVLGICFTDGLVVQNIGAIFGSENVTFFGVGAILFTIFAVIGAVNSVNMIDGLDGLLASLGLVSVVTVCCLTEFYGNFDGFGLTPISIAAIIGALIGFLMLNSRLLVNEARVFLGDAGSTMMGFLLVYLLVDHSQGSNASFSPVLAGWILGLPLLDASAVIVLRLLDGDSPFKPDRRHLHHCLMDAGKSVNSTVRIMLTLHCLVILVGIIITGIGGHLADAMLFWGFVFLVGLRLALTPILPEIMPEYEPISAVRESNSPEKPVKFPAARRFSVKRTDRVA